MVGAILAAVAIVVAVTVLRSRRPEPAHGHAAVGEPAYDPA
jgi:hypothetical protein